MAKRPKKDSGGGANWMDTYGDLVTLLLCFFVLLFAFSSMDDAKWSQLVETFTGSPPAAIMEPVDPTLPVEGLAESDIIPAVFMNPQDLMQTNTQEHTNPEEQQILIEMTDLKEALDEYVTTNNLVGMILVDQDNHIIYVTMREGVLFDSGKADIKPEGQEYLKEMGDIIYSYIHDVQSIFVLGHTDNRPIDTVRFPDNLSLSTERANATIRYLETACGISQEDYSVAMGRSEWDPIATNDTDEGRAQNRRVELIIVSKYGELDLGGLFER